MTVLSRSTRAARPLLTGAAPLAASLLLFHTLSVFAQAPAPTTPSVAPGTVAAPQTAPAQAPNPTPANPAQPNPAQANPALQQRPPISPRPTPTTP